MTVPLLSIQDLQLAFKTSKGLHPILFGVNLSLHAGEAVALIGESGSGKSVMALAVLQLLSRSAVITGGEIHFQEMPLLKKSAKEMTAIRGKKIGMVFQDPMTSLNPTLTIGKQLTEAVTAHERLPKFEALSRSIKLLQRVGIPDAAERFHAYPFQLSGGMRQRVLIAMALSCNPSLLIADEPTTALDVTVQAQILNLLSDIRQETGMGLLLITHDIAAAATICDRAVVMHSGKIVETGPIKTLYHSAEHPYTRILFNAKKGGF